MAKHKYNKLLSRLLREIVKLSQTLTRQTLRWLWRSFFVANRRRQNQAGFVLPTVAMLLMVVALVVGAIMFRTFTRTNQVIGQGQQQVIKNAATPAIDRAKAKLEYLFNDPNLEAGIPAEKRLEELLLNTDARDPDPYKLNDEERVDLGITGLDVPSTTAWKFQTDTDGDGQNDLTTIYAIVARAERNEGSQKASIDPENNALYTESVKERADAFIVRNGPLVSQSGNASANCPVPVGGNPAGWFNGGAGSGSANVFKAFQVYAVTVPNSPNSKAGIATIEYQQDRQYDRGNKWGAWFRYDLEIAPGPRFNWNGAMHSQGNIFLRGYDGLRSLLISSQNSCVFNPTTNSQITVRRDAPPSQGANQQTFTGGQVVGGTLRFNNFTQLNQNIFIDTNAAATTGGSSTVEFRPASTASNGQSAHSVMGSNTQTVPIATDPLALQTTGILRARGPGLQPNTVSFWPQNSPLTQSNRIAQAISCAPYVDDSYRADNRYGPKPSYSAESFNSTTGRCEADPEGNYGQPIPVSAANDRLLRADPPPGDLQGESVGLDGYWERRARSSGLRVIVGQRLDLGNTFGWGTNGADPLNPQTNDSNATTGSAPWATAPNTDRRNEARQYRTLRDNLAAAQATAVYYYSFGDNSSTENVNEGGYFPISYVATTVHPGTVNTLNNSSRVARPASAFKITTSPLFTGTEFGETSGNTNDEFLIDFFTGQGTNGWEFNTTNSTYNASNFATQIAADKPLGKALRNLAMFAGDTDGYFPPKQETSGTTVHPYPNLTMWGDFSNLRETLRLLDNVAGTTYDKLSIADKTNLHTAAGTLGMLAYNISYLQAYDTAQTPPPELTSALNPGSVPTNNPDAAITAVIAGGNQNAIQRAYIVHLKEQIQRDRKLGFAANPTPNQPEPDCTSRLGALAKLCPTGPKFPALYYLFPLADHAHNGSTPTSTTATQPTTEPYIADTYIQGINLTPDTGRNRYKVVSNDSTKPEDLSAIALKPRDLNAWTLPKASMGSGSCDTSAELHFDPNQNFINYPDGGNGGSCLRIPLKDSARFDGREMMSVRLLNMDLDLMRRNRVAGLGTSDTWLPPSGLVYAFREDAVREDAIARPATAANTMQVWTPSDPSVCMPTINAAGEPVCQPLTGPNQRGISPKPVDYVADPDRRPYGFRLKNGSDLRRMPNGTAVDTTNPRGLSFISDNPIYIQGDFNPHRDSATGARVEEFNDITIGTLPLNNAADQTAYVTAFYNRSSLDTRFARTGTDNWRPAEILGDAVNILSRNSCDGSIQSGIRSDNSDCGNRPSSYQDSHMWSTATASTPGDVFNTLTWICENSQDPRTSGARSCDSPVKVFRNGVVKHTPGTPTDYTQYRAFNQNRTSFNADPNTGQAYAPATTAPQTEINAVMISGIVPSRASQSNGGLVNFPRMHETWRSTNLLIYGAMIQLNFSSYATAPWDHEAWEPGGTAPTPTENIRYYYPPNRLWGYDVALQYAPAAPVARRMVIPAPGRTEIYREPEANDPYICKLRAQTSFPCPPE